MRTLARLISAVALVGTIAPPTLLLAGGVSPGQMKAWMFAAALAWFATAPLWLGRAGNRQGGAP